MNVPTSLCRNGLYWRNLIGTLDLSREAIPNRIVGSVRGDPCPGPLRMHLRGVLREAFRAGNRSATLADELVELKELIEFHPANVSWEEREQAPGVSILIPVRGAHAELQLCLSRLIAHTPRLTAPGHRADMRAEVVIVCSAEESGAVRRAALAASCMPFRVHVHETPAPQGFPANVNFARRHASGDFLVLLNSDAYVSDGWLEALLAPFETPQVAAVGPRAQIRKAIDPSAPDAFKRLDAAVEKYAAADAAAGAAETNTRRLVGFCLAVRATRFDAIGGLWEGYGLGNYDDDDLSARLLLCRGELIETAHARVVHPSGASFRDLKVNYNELLGVNARLYQQRWGWIAPDLHAWLDEAGVPPVEHKVFLA